MNTFTTRALPFAAAAFLAAAALAGPPQYTIIDLGVVVPGQSASQGNGVSRNGVAVGRCLGTPSQAFSWTQVGGIVGLPNDPSRNFCVANAANDFGQVVGTGSTTAFGSGAIPLIWTNGVVAQLPLPSGYSIGRANDVNDAGVSVGSVGSGTGEVGSIWLQSGPSAITAATSTGCVFRTAYGINNAGIVCGFGIDPGNAARNVGMIYDSESNISTEVGALPGGNGALAFGISDGGHIVGSSMMNQGSGLPFIWTEATGIQPIPLPAGTSQGSARAVNSAGWAVGTASSAFAIPFLYDGTQTYRLADLLPAGTGWDLATNTSSAALGISENGIIVGTGVLGGQVRAFAMVPAGEPCAADFDGNGTREVPDIFAFLSAWFAGDASAEFDGAPGITVPDIFAFLSEWFAGC